MRALKGFVMFCCILEGFGCGITARVSVSVSFRMFAIVNLSKYAQKYIFCTCFMGLLAYLYAVPYL